MLLGDKFQKESFKEVLLSQQNLRGDSLKQCKNMNGFHLSNDSNEFNVLMKMHLNDLKLQFNWDPPSSLAKSDE